MNEPVRLIIPRNKYGSLEDGIKTTIKLPPTDNNALEQISAGSKPAAIGLGVRLLLVLTRGKNLSKLVADLVQATGFDNKLHDRQWSLAQNMQHVTMLLRKQAADITTMADNAQRLTDLIVEHVEANENLPDSP